MTTLIISILLGIPAVILAIALWQRSKLDNRLGSTDKSLKKETIKFAEIFNFCKSYVSFGLVFVLLLVLFWNEHALKMASPKIIFSLIIAFAIIVVSKKSEAARIIAAVVIIGIVGYCLIWPAVSPGVKKAFAPGQMVIDLDPEKWSVSVKATRPGQTISWTGPPGAQVQLLADGSVYGIETKFGNDCRSAKGLRFRGPAGGKMLITFD